MTNAQAQLKRKAGEYAVRFVKSGMIVGLGHGTTAIYAIRRLAAKIECGELTDILGVPCSLQVAKDARSLGIPLTTLNDHPVIDVTIDGADEVNPRCDVIKGGGGALLREKIVAQATRREVIVVDPSKLSEVLGAQWAVPVEVVSFGWQTQIGFLESIGAKVEARYTGSGNLLKTDQGNLILDCDFGPMQEPAAVAEALAPRAGIVEHGLFLDLVDDVIVADPEGVRHLRTERRSGGRG
jgi:ribose 5-phosphate isomerase A